VGEEAGERAVVVVAHHPLQTGGPQEGTSRSPSNLPATKPRALAAPFPGWGRSTRSRGTVASPRRTFPGRPTAGCANR
jgi:hypothetical protein